MVVDMNLFFAQGDNGFNVYGPVPNVRWFYSNHAYRNRFDPRGVELRKFVRGSNRLYADGHVKWASTDEMGRADTVIKVSDKVSSLKDTSARYSHMGDDRVYFW